MEFTDHVTDAHAEMIGQQAIFFTATAAADGRINLSPKGLADTFKVLGPKRVAYLDLGGSGNETHAHLAADGRITIMMCHHACFVLTRVAQGRAFHWRFPRKGFSADLPIRCQRDGGLVTYVKTLTQHRQCLAHGGNVSPVAIEQNNLFKTAFYQRPHQIHHHLGI